MRGSTISENPPGYRGNAYTPRIAASSLTEWRLPRHEFLTFLATHKRYWLLPLLIFVAVLGAILFIAERREAIAPFVYGDNRFLREYQNADSKLELTTSRLKTRRLITASSRLSS